MTARVVAILTLVVISTLPWNPSGAVLKDYRFLSKNITSTLDQLLNRSRYDKRIRPGFGGPPVAVRVNMHIKSMGSVSETDQEYVMDCYFRQAWYDGRLAFSFPGLDEFSLSWLFLDRVWKPDTFFLNGKKSHLHRITVPNKFLRLRSDGSLMYSMRLLLRFTLKRIKQREFQQCFEQCEWRWARCINSEVDYVEGHSTDLSLRLTIKAKCPMHLRKFPLDSQSCPLLIGSYGYGATDLVYEWDKVRPVSVEQNVELSQYQLVNKTTEHFPKFLRGVEEYSVIKVEFHLRRNIGYFVLQLYVPCGLIVSCSWVSFWIDPDAVPARVQLAVMTVLSMTTIGFSGRAQMPRVSYATALDSFVIICFSFVFAVIIEYAAINCLDKMAKDMKKMLQERRTKQTLPDSPDLKAEQPRSVSMLNISSPSSRIYSDAADSDAAGDKDTHLKAPDGEKRRKSLTALAAPLMDSLKRTLERRKSEISLHLPSLSILSERRKSDACLSKPPIPLITVSGNEGDFETPVEEECVREDIQLHGRRYSAADEVVHISCSEVCEDVEEGDGKEGPGSKCLRYVAVIIRALRKCLMRPWVSWKNAKILPTEEEISRMIVTGEMGDKFSRIDIESRKYFPIAFCILMLSYWIAYMYYITDEFPVQAMDPLY